MDGRLGIGYGDSQYGIMNYIHSEVTSPADGLEETGYTLKVGDWTSFKAELEDWLVCTYFWDEIKANRPTS